MQRESILYEGVGGVSRVAEGTEIRYDVERDCWTVVQLRTDRGGFTRVAHVPKQRVYTVDTIVEAGDTHGGAENFIDGKITYDGPEGEASIDSGGIEHGELWHDTASGHWVVRQASDEQGIVVQQYVPDHRVVLVEERIDEGF